MCKFIIDNWLIMNYKVNFDIEWYDNIDFCYL